MAVKDVVLMGYAGGTRYIPPMGYLGAAVELGTRNTAKLPYRQFTSKLMAREFDSKLPYRPFDTKLSI